MARCIWQNSEGLWEIEERTPVSGSRPRPVNAERFSPPVLPAFPSREDAALFAYMEGRYYHTTVTPSDGPIQIMVSPNFGDWKGQWVASLHYEKDGKCAGSNSCSASLSEAKTLGLRLALRNDTPDADDREWQEATVNRTF